jgi:hypothetical protein
LSGEASEAEVMDRLTRRLNPEVGVVDPELLLPPSERVVALALNISIRLSVT